MQQCLVAAAPFPNTWLLYDDATCAAKLAHVAAPEQRR